MLASFFPDKMPLNSFFCCCFYVYTFQKIGFCFPFIFSLEDKLFPLHKKRLSKVDQNPKKFKLFLLSYFSVQTFTIYYSLFSGGTPEKQDYLPQRNFVENTFRPP